MVVPGQVGQLLPRERHRHEHAAAIRLADPIGELQEQPGETRLDPRAGELRQAAGQLGQADREAGQQAPHERRILFEQPEERRLLDPHAFRALEGDRRRRERYALIDGNSAQRIASAENLEDDLLAGGRRLEHLHAAGDDGDERVAVVAFAEDHVAAFVSPGARDLRHPGASISRQPAKERDTAQLLVVGRGRHGRMIADYGRRRSSSSARGNSTSFSARRCSRRSSSRLANADRHCRQPSDEPSVATNPAVTSRR